MGFRIAMSTSRLLVNIENLKKNYLYLDNLSNKNVITAAVVKSDAYGLGCETISQSLHNIGCKNFFCAQLEEAINIRKVSKKINIFVFEGPFEKNLKDYKYFNITPIINSEEQLNIILDAKRKLNHNFQVVLNIDTGMNRLGLGFHEKKTPNLIENLINLHLKGYLNILFIMSHLSCSEDSRSLNNIDQLNKFNIIKSKFKKIPASFSNTGGILLGKKYHFYITRPGIGIYGCNPNGNLDENFKNVVELEADILQIRDIKKNEYVGYGGDFKSKKKMKLATIGIGYADGYNRLLQNKGLVKISDFLIPLVGRVSMDLIVLDVSSIPNNILNKTKTVKLIGEHYNIDRMSKDINSISWETLTKFGHRVERIYK